MIKSTYEWKLAESKLSATQINALAQTTGHSPEVIKILSQRGIKSKDEIKNFLSPSGKCIHNAYLLYDMEKAIDRIQQAIIENQKIYIYGDYDADGITSTAVMYETLMQLGADVHYFIPDRFRDGYGPNLAEYQKLANDGMKLLITVDNGVSGYDEVQYLMDQGIDVIITDHHELPQKLPPAYAIIHPNHPEGNYPFKSLAGVGVAFKVACALLDDIPQEELDLVAIGTIADMVSLTDENRDLVYFGIKELRATIRPGLLALYEKTKTNPDEISENTIGFTIAPRLNSLGRLESASLGVKLLTTLDDEEANQLADHTIELNTKRQEIVADIVAEAENQIKGLSTPHPINIIAGENWHEGVLGIVASRIVGMTNRPTVVLTLTKEGIYKGSGRSVEGFNMFKAFDAHRKLFESFGGHALACGVSIKPDNLPGFQVIADQEAINQHFNADQKSILTIDDQISADEITFDLVHELNSLAPFGMDNQCPIFEIKGLQLPQFKVIGSDQQHFRIDFRNNTQAISAVQFNATADRIAELQQNSLDGIEIVGKLTENRWQGRVNLQIQLEDLRVPENATLQPQFIDRRFDNCNHSLNSQFVYGFFDKNLLKRVKSQIHSDAKLILLDEKTQLTVDTLVVVDCPPSILIFQKLIKHLQVRKIVLKCYTRLDISTKPMPGRQDFGKLYRFVVNHQQVNVRQDLAKLAMYLNFDQEVLVFMIQVFAEVGFVTLDDGLMSGNMVNQQVDLTQSVRYQKRLCQIESQRLFLHSSLSDLLKRLN